VELAILIPLMLVAAFVSMNLISFMGDCAKFDRVAAEAVRVHGVSAPYGGYGAADCSKRIRETIESAFAGEERLGFEVSDSESDPVAGADPASFSFFPLHRKYVCTMKGGSLLGIDSMFGVEFLGLEHRKGFVVAPFKAGGLI
jgi:hypothetical protein